MNSESLFSALGFRWDRAALPTDVPVHSIERVSYRFHRMLAEFVWDAGVLEGIPVTISEVMTLLDGVAVSGRSRSDQELILDIAAGCRRLRQSVRARSFLLDVATIRALSTSAHGEEWSSDFVHLLEVAIDRLQDCEPIERALVLFVFNASQPELAGWKSWNSLLLMNGVLMSNGLDAISVPASKANDFNEQMSLFRTTKDATAVLRTLADCRFRPEQHNDLVEMQKLEAVVCELVPEFLQVRVRDDDGNIFAITQATVGVDLTQLVAGERLMCIVTRHLPRVLEARLIVEDD